MQTITVEELKAKLAAGENIHLVDVRETHERADFNIGGSHLPRQFAWSDARLAEPQLKRRPPGKHVRQQQGRIKDPEQSDDSRFQRRVEKSIPRPCRSRPKRPPGQR